MKKTIHTHLARAIVLWLISHPAFSQSTIETIDIINKSDIPVTVTYEECRVHIAYSKYNITPTPVCSEQKTIALSALHGGANYAYITPVALTTNDDDDTKDDENIEISSPLLIIRKISSTLGEQNLLSLEELIKMSQDIEIGNVSKDTLPSLCIGVKGFFESDTTQAPNVLLLDTMGTNKFYCQSSYQAS